MPCPYYVIDPPIRHAVPLLRHWPTYTPCRAPTTSLAHLYAMPCPYYVIVPPIRHAVPLQSGNRR
ncbi:MAG: hypothetical protein KatS3mg109_1394 [Pirellulaceae bacterium]|nr:MAG: hypothetical protein KatS3mg109_1394 [Pirellulaceae bacterium]